MRDDTSGASGQCVVNGELTAKSDNTIELVLNNGTPRTPENEFPGQSLRSRVPLFNTVPIVEASL